MRTRSLPVGELIIKAALDHYLKGVKVLLVAPGKLPVEPTVYLKRTGGVAASPGEVDQGTYQFRVFGGRFSEAAELGQALRDALYAAEAAQFSTAKGRMGKVTEISAPSPLTQENEGSPFVRYATYNVITR